MFSEQVNTLTNQDLFILTPLTEEESYVASKRIKIKKRLVSVYKAFQQLEKNPHHEIHIENKFFVLKSPMLKNDGTQSTPATQVDIKDYIYSLFVKSRDLKICYFLDEEGCLSSLLELETKLKNKFENAISFTSKSLDKQLKRQLKKDPCWNENKMMLAEQSRVKSNPDSSFFDPLSQEDKGKIKTENEMLFYTFLQNIFPIRHVTNTTVHKYHMLPQLTLLSSYIRQISTSTLFKLGALTLKQKGNPQQILRILHFFRTWCESNLHQKDKNLKEVHSALAELKISCANLNNKEFVRFFNEIQMLFKTSTEPSFTSIIQFDNQNECLSTDQLLNRIAEYGIECDEFQLFIKAAVPKIKTYSAYYAAELSPYFLLDDKYIPSLKDVGNFSDKVGEYIMNTYLRFKESFSKDPSDSSKRDSPISFIESESPSTQSSIERNSRSLNKDISNLKDAARKHASIHSASPHSSSPHSPSPHSASPHSPSPNSASPLSTSPELSPKEKELDKLQAVPSDSQMTTEKTQQFAISNRNGSEASKSFIPALTAHSNPSIEKGSSKARNLRRVSSSPDKSPPPRRYRSKGEGSLRPKETKSSSFSKEDKVCNNLILLFISLAHELKEQNDFLTSCPIYHKLNSDPIRPQILKLKSKFKEGWLRKKEKDRKIADILKNFDSLSELFPSTGVIAPLVHKINKCQRKEKYVIPHIGCYKNFIIREIGPTPTTIKLENEEEIINYEQMHHASKIIWKTHDLLQSIRFYLAQDLENEELKNSLVHRDVIKKIFEQNLKN